MDFCELTEEFWETYFSGTEAETSATAAEWLAPQCVVMVTSTHEFYLNKDDFIHTLANEVHEREGTRFQYNDFSCEQMQLGSDSVLVYGKIHIECENEDKSIFFDADNHFTFLYQNIGGVWQIVHIHQSVPDQEQAEGGHSPKNISEVLKRYKEKIEEITIIAQKDSLTGLNNFRFFGAKWKQRCGDGWLFILDIDELKKVNDTYGHLKGNEVIVSISNIIGSSIHKNDFVCRMGGDEFLVFCSMLDENEATKFAHRLIQDIGKAGTDKEYWTTISIGAAYAPSDIELEVALDKADRSLYYVKRTHRGCLFVEQ